MVEIAASIFDGFDSGFGFWRVDDESAMRTGGAAFASTGLAFFSWAQSGAFHSVDATKVAARSQRLRFGIAALSAFRLNDGPSVQHGAGEWRCRNVASSGLV